MAAISAPASACWCSAVLSIATGGDYRAANVAKNIVIGLNTFAASLMLSLHGAVSWPPTLVMMAGCVIGGLLGAPRSRASFRSAVMRVVRRRGRTRC